MFRSMYKMLHDLSMSSKYYIVLIATQLKLAWDQLLHQSFVHSYKLAMPEYFDHGPCVTRFEYDEGSSDSVECAVCLCKIEEGDEIRELVCDHLFHRECLDRWLGRGRMTCPLCRGNLKMPRMVSDTHQEVLLFNYCAARPDDYSMWWIR